jgi:pimeloyl-ACP methyl ester carboxylesterase
MGTSRRFAACLPLALCLALLVPTGAPAAAKLRSCDLGTARPLRCGHVTVPLLRGDPALGSTRIGFAVRPRGDRSRPSLGTIFAVDGGPGYASTAAPYVRSFAAALAPLLRRHDVVFFDERGTGRSGAIDCRPLQRGTIQEAIAIGQCADQLGPSYAAYTTVEAAADMDAVRAALGPSQITLYGDSYGTLLGQAYAVRYPSHLRGLILDSAYPADDPYYRTLFPAFRRGLRIACRRAPKCHGNAIRRFRRVVRSYHHRKIPTGNLIGFALEAGTLAPRSYLSLDDGDRRYLHGNRRRLQRLINPGSPEQGNVHVFSYGLEVTVECNDYPLMWKRRASEPERRRQLTASIRRLPRHFFAPLRRREYLTSEEAHLVTCLTWPRPPADGLEPPVPRGWRAPARLRTLILAGELDDITSVREARQTARRFHHPRLYIDPNRGHVSDLYFPFRSPAVGVIRRFIRRH